MMGVKVEGATKLYFTQASGTSSLDALKSANVDGSSLTTLADNSDDFLQPKGIAVDTANGYIYVADSLSTGAGIVRYNLDGSGRVVVVAATASAVYNDVAVGGGKIYFTQGSATTSLDAIKSANLDGTGVTTLASDSGNFAQPGGIAVDTVNSHLYVADSVTSGGGILRFNLDGSGRTQLVPATASAIYNDVTVAGSKIYFTQGSATSSLDALKSANLDGSSVTTLASDSANFAQPSGLAVDVADGHIYVADALTPALNGAGILRYNLNGSGRTVIVSPTTSALYHDVSLDGGDTPPSTPSVPDLASGSDTGSSSTDNITSDNTPTFTGTGQASSTITLISSVNGTVGSGTVDGGGQWSVTASTLSGGAHTITATATTGGGTSAASSGLSITIDTTPPAAPSVTGVSSDTGTSVSDEITSDTTLVLAGTAEAGSTVTVSRTGVGSIGSATANGGGSWSLDYTGTTLSAGDHTFTATATDTAGNTSSTSSGLTVTVDTTPPAAPSVTGISSDTGTSASDEITSDTTLVLAGTAEAGSTVTVSRTGVGSIGSTTANGGGSWSLEYTGTTLSAGDHTFTATATDTAGNTSSTSSGLTVTVDTAAPTLSLGAPSALETAAFSSSVTYTVTYTGADSITLGAGDVTLNTTGTAAATVGVSGVGSTRTITLSAITGVGTLSVTVGSGTASDTAGNLAGSAGPSGAVTLLLVDWGDAPSAAQSGFAASYPVLAADQGARHRIPSGGATVYLGPVAPDGEADGLPEASSLGDDADALDDEGGVTLPSSFPGGTSVDLTVAVVGNGRLSAWVDWNRDGDWEDTGEHVIVDQSLTAAGSPHTVSVSVPSNVTSGSTFARFRYATEAGLDATGEALDGEVEDYALNLVANTLPSAGGDVMETLEDEPAAVFAVKLLVNDTDGDGDELSVTQVTALSTAGGSVVLASGVITYTPPADFAGSDTFTYTVADGRGGTALGTVTVTVREGDAIGGNGARITPSAGGFLVRFSGIPGADYQVQWADNATGPWNALGSPVTASPLGIVEVEDTTFPLPDERFFRMIAAP
jgi:hypothetical protein